MDPLLKLKKAELVERVRLIAGDLTTTKHNLKGKIDGLEKSLAKKARNFDELRNCLIRIRHSLLAAAAMRYPDAVFSPSSYQYPQQYPFNTESKDYDLSEDFILFRYIYDLISNVPLEDR